MLKINIDTHPEEAIKTAVTLFYNGGVFAYPTDTIYGFGANPFNADAVAKITKIKNRDISKKGYIMLAESIPMVLRYVELENEGLVDALAAVWPDPVSVLFRLKQDAGSILNNDTAVFRVPNHQFCRMLLSRLEMPLLSTSVNKSDEPALNDPRSIEEQFGESIDALFYSERKIFSVASTIVDLTGETPALIREGKIRFDDLLAKINRMYETL